MARAWLAFFTGLFLILAVSLLPHHRPKGHYVQIAVRPVLCGNDDHPVVLRVGPQGALELYRKHVTLDQIPERLRAIMHTRAYRVIYVAGHAKAAYGDVVRAIEATPTHVDYIALLTPQVEKSEGACLGINLGSFRDVAVEQLPVNVQPVPQWPW